MQQCLISASFGILPGCVINSARRLAGSCECTCICLHLFCFQLSFHFFINRPIVSVLIPERTALPNGNCFPSMQVPCLSLRFSKTCSLISYLAHVVIECYTPWALDRYRTCVEVNRTLAFRLVVLPYCRWLARLRCENWFSPFQWPFSHPFGKAFPTRTCFFFLWRSNDFMRQFVFTAHVISFFAFCCRTVAALIAHKSVA